MVVLTGFDPDPPMEGSVLHSSVTVVLARLELR